MASHRIYRYTSIGRPLDPKYATNKAVLLLMPAAALLGIVVALMAGETGTAAALHGVTFLLIVFASWALARELDPDDNPAAFIAMSVAAYAALTIDSPGILIAFTTLGLVRMVNRSTGLAARKTDSIVMLLLTFWVIYGTESPVFGAVAALAFILDGTLKNPLRHQWFFGLVCLGGAIVYIIDHDIGLGSLAAPDSLFEWMALLFLLIFALNMLLLKNVFSKGDFGGEQLEVARVKGGMAVGLLAALQGINRPEGVVIIVAAIAGICIGMAFRKRFKTPVGR
jgi:hypothetical protein